MKKAEKTQLTILKILDAAMNEFGKNGYSGGKINNICNSGINKGLLYHNFNGKDDIYLTCLKHNCDKLVSYLKSKNCTENLDSYMSAHMEFFNSYQMKHGYALKNKDARNDCFQAFGLYVIRNCKRRKVK